MSVIEAAAAGPTGCEGTRPAPAAPTPDDDDAMIAPLRARRHSTRHTYYTCWNLARYDADFKRPNADEVDTATLDALATFYRDRHDLITPATHAEQQRHKDAHADRHTELRAVETKISETNNAIERYLAAFERGTLDDETVGDRLRELRTKSKQLRTRRDELTLALDDEPTAPDPATLNDVADHFTDVIETGNHNQRKALVENLTRPGLEPGTPGLERGGGHGGESTVMARVISSQSHSRPGSRESRVRQRMSTAKVTSSSGSFCHWQPSEKVGLSTHRAGMAATRSVFAITPRISNQLGTVSTTLRRSPRRARASSIMLVPRAVAATFTCGRLR
jgi:hypothetical protein